MPYQLTTQESKTLQEIQKKYYMIPVLERINQYLSNDTNSYIQVFNKIYLILRESESDVRTLVKLRKDAGEIKNEDQAIKSIVGNIFPSCVLYLFLQNKIIGNIQGHIFITSKKKQVIGFEEISVIKIGEEDTQKPDCDLIIYKYHHDTSTGEISLAKCIILSLKTSMRERAAQTYKWKLLLEIANDQNCQVRKKYDITYGVNQVPLICFVTVNFYNEINNPQQRGMLKFFDRAFLAKELDSPSDFIHPMSDIVRFVNTELGND